MTLRFLGIAVIVLIVCAFGWRFYNKHTAFDRLREAPHHQYVGSENPSVIITEIMDYRCPYCRQMHDSMTAFVALHPEIRVIYRAYPIFAQPAIRDAKLAMAAGNQGKFEQMHNKLIRRDTPITLAEEAALIEELGLNKEQFEKDMLSWELTKDLLDGSAAVEALGIKSTPTLIVNSQIYEPKDRIPTVEDLEEWLAPHLESATKDSK